MFRTLNLRQSPFLTWQSIRVKMMLGLFLTVIPLIAFLIYSNVYAIHTVRTQVAESSKDLLSLYRSQVDARLQEADNYLNGLMLEPELSDFDFYTEPDERLFVKQRINNNLSNSILRYSVLDGLFVYLPSDDAFLYSFQTRSTYSDRVYLKDYIVSDVSKSESLQRRHMKSWYVQRSGDQTYLMRFFVMPNSAVAGAWINMNSFKTPLELLGIGEKGAALLVDDRGNALVNQSFIRDTGVQIKLDEASYYLTGEQDRYLTVGERSREGEFSLYAFIPEEKILQQLPTLRAISFILPFASILILLLGLVLLRKTLLIPLNRLLKAMNRIQQGNLDTQIKQFPTSIEFRTVNDTFNTMMDQIKHLRINVYEEQLNKQKAELQHLQLQIKPHFYINTLNLLHTLAKTKELKLLEELSLYLIRYFRYMFQSNLSFVTLRDELQHVRNYLRIQELRFPGQLIHEIKAPDFLLNTPVPPLVIQTFVENAVKHAITLDDPVYLYIDLEMKEEPQTGILIQIRDTGPGFPDNILSLIEAEERIVDEEGEHIGIRNLRQRLRLLYHGRGEVTLRNAEPHGAEIEITLPFEPENRTNYTPGGTASC
ncbi:two-component sensor histidine kinase [Paenibacillus sp. PK3_47]|uniref:sensor histidine kinase n=1 Tax=Paenibacillus sp. PK3_47 TaxID=2072642 RepID=UPI00201E2024|nr:histidine kinase [Paenibacillus sp. PK3_47]UQZ35492.1 two-component sensor histidine kinase [Paenibacillus sp. PK3_47]